MNVVRCCLWTLCIVGACQVSAADAKKGWNVEDETRKMVEFETGRKLIAPVAAVAEQAEPLVVRLTRPQYRNNFYPGQDASTRQPLAIATLAA